MPVFHYVAVDAAGKQVRGSLDARDQAALADRIRDQNCLLLRARADSERGFLQGLLSLELTPRKQLGHDEVMHLTRELAVMQGAGQDLDQAMRFLVETASGARLRTVLQDLRDQIRGGASLATALSRYPKAFSRLYIGLVRAGESSGTLSQTLNHLATMLERQRSLTSTVQSALIYPLLLVIAAISSITLLLVFVLPQFSQIFDEAGAKLPAATQTLLDIGAFVRQDGWLLLAVLLGGGLVVRRMLQLPAQRRAVDRLLLRLPVLGSLIRQTEAARLSRTLGTLLGNGVGMLGALQISRQVVQNQIAAEAIERASLRIKEGIGLGAALADSPAFPARTIHLMRLGGETGRLSEMLLRAADIHEEEVRVTVQRLVALLVPVITILMGIAIAGIIGSLLVAMMSLNDLAT